MRRKGPSPFPVRRGPPPSSRPNGALHTTAQRAILLPPGYLHTSGAAIVSADDVPVRLAGVNWYGMDCTGMVVGGLDHRPLERICALIAELGFNTIRLPFSVQLVREDPPITRYLGANPRLQGRPALTIMDAVIEASAEQGLKVILDSHRSEAGWSTQSNGLWYTQAYGEEGWLDAWLTLAARYADDDTVIGCDLHNEPGAPPPDPAAWPRNGGAVWGYDTRIFGIGRPADWAAAATRAGNAILAVNPNLLIIVEGVRSDPACPRANGNIYWPGGNLMGVGHAAGRRRAAAPISLNVPDRLVYSAHDYGPDMSRGLPWGQPDSTAAERVSVWDATWGYIVRDDIAPVWLGEFGTPNGRRPGDRSSPDAYTDPNPLNPQGAWFSDLISYLADLQRNHSAGHWCYWCLNGTQSPAPGRDPSLPDWYGLLDPIWSEVASEPLMAKLRSIQ